MILQGVLYPEHIARYAQCRSWPRGEVESVRQIKVPIPLCRRPVAADGVKQARAREELFSIVQNGLVWCNIFGFMELVEIQLGAHGCFSQSSLKLQGSILSRCSASTGSGLSPSPCSM